MKTVGEILKGRDVHHVNFTDSVLEVASYMTRCHIGAVAVVQGDRLVGLFSERDLMQRVVAAGKDPRTTTVADVMTTDLVVAEANDDLRACVQRMVSAKVRHLPVVSGDKFLGMVAIMELLQAEIRDLDLEVQMLTDYVYHIAPQK
jgi:CBS domain-containing protein